MTDEEKAVKFASSGYALGCTKSPFETAKEAYLAGLKAGKNTNEGENYELRIKITILQELLTDCLFYCYHVDPYYINCLKEDEIFERAEKLGVKYNV